MPQIRAIVWNLEVFGIASLYKANQAVQCALIAQVAALYNADVILIEELREWAITNYTLQRLQSALNALPAPQNNWYYNYVKGAVASNGTSPFATEADLMWDAAHYEGYAVFWNQNISKFLVSRAPPIQPPAGAPVANSQSGTVRMQATIPVLGGPLPGLPVPAGGILVPGGGPAYTFPIGTVVPPNAPLAAPATVAAGTAVPVGTIIGVGGATLNTAVNGINPVVIPGGYTLTDALTLPAVGAVLVPEHAVSLVLFGRDTGTPPANALGDISGAVANFAPGGPNNWNWQFFTRGGGYPAMGPTCRRPAYITLDVNRAPPNNGSADRLVPMIVYHAPSSATAAASGMQRASYAQPLYQAYDWGAGNWVDCNNALLGGDFNIAIDTTQYPYAAFTNGFGAGGANCAIAVNNPAPPPPPPNPTRANNPLNKSMVLISDFGAPVYSANLNDYRNLAIDNIFFRGFAGGTLSVLADLLVSSTGGAPVLPVPSITAFLGLPVFAQALAALAGAPGALMPFTPNINAIASTLFDINAGVFGAAPNAGNNTTARRAAEFVQLCISDHLPIVFQMTL